MSKRKFYKTTITMVVLSEDPISDDAELSDIVSEGEDGSYVLRATTDEQKELDGKQMAKALKSASSEPDFFQLDDEGNDA